MNQVRFRNQDSPVGMQRIARFGLYEADLRARELRRQGHRLKLQIQPFEVLLILLERPGEVITRKELRGRLWSEETFVDFDRSLNTAVGRLRETLADSAENPIFIETLQRQGYRFIAPVVFSDGQPNSDALPSNSDPLPSNSDALPSNSHPLPSKRTQNVSILLLAILLLIACSIAFLDMGKPWAKTPLDRMWSPILRSPDRVLLCVGPPLARPNGAASGARPSVGHGPWPPDVAFKDAAAISQIFGLMRENKKEFSIRTVADTTFSDLRGGPAVLVGAYNNTWTMRLEDILRYRFFTDNPDEPSLVGIVDQQDPKTSWIVRLPISDTYQDYAIVGRINDPRTTHPVVFVAGVRGFGTLAAGRFLTDPQYMGELSHKLPKDWERKNIEVVLATDVIDLSGGPPRVVAWYVW